MVQYIKSDLEFILAQIKIAEAHAAGQPLYGPGGLIPTYNLAWGLRTVDGSNNHLLPGQEKWGAAGNQFPELVDATFDPAQNIPPPFAPPGPAIATSLQSFEQSWFAGFRLNAPHDLQPAGRSDPG